MVYNSFPQYDPLSEFGLAHRTNQFMSSQGNLALANALPGYAGNVRQSGANVSSFLQGQIPSDVITQLKQGAAERAIASGIPGSPNASAAYLRALGLTSLDMIDRGEKYFSAGVERAPIPQLYNPASAFVPRQNAYDELNAAMYGRGGGSRMMWKPQNNSFRMSGPAFSNFYS